MRSLPGPSPSVTYDDIYDRACDLVEATARMRRAAATLQDAQVAPALLNCIEAALHDLAGTAAALEATSVRSTAEHRRAAADTRGRLIACVDGGPGGRAAARLGASLAAGLRSELLLAAVHPGGLRLPAETDLDRGVVRDARAAVALAARDLDPAPESRIAFGEPAERLIALAARERASLIIVPRPAGQPQALLGNVHLALAGAAPCPVVVVPAGAEPNPYGPIVCGIDGSEPSRAGARVAANLASRLGVRLSLVHAPHSRHGCAAETSDSARGELPADRLAEVAEEEAAQLVATGSRGRSGEASKLLGSVASRLAAVTTRPCLIVPPTALSPAG